MRLHLNCLSRDTGECSKPYTTHLLRRSLNSAGVFYAFHFVDRYMHSRTHTTDTVSIGVVSLSLYIFLLHVVNIRLQLITFMHGRCIVLCQKQLRASFYFVSILFHDFIDEIMKNHSSCFSDWSIPLFNLNFCSTSILLELQFFLAGRFTISTFVNQELNMDFF